MAEPTPPTSLHGSPPRSVSPSPSITPSMALGACPELDRCVSDATTISSTLSSRSVSAASEAGVAPNRRRGYMRPHGTAFSDSAKNRDSVMSLGSIAHMQYYFARTGLLDGKGAQLARKAKDAAAIDGDSVRIVSDGGLPYDEEKGSGFMGEEDSMLPPTVSTYKAKVIEPQPPPDIRLLRSELLEALKKARLAVDEIQEAPASPQAPTVSPVDDQSSDSQGWHEIQGLHILDILTLAIRSAKDYYTFHNHPQMLYVIRSEREIRTDLYQALDILKRMANRSFRGGIRSAERDGISQWINSIDTLLQQEQEREEEREHKRKQWQWLQGDWTGREREREWLFLASFSTHADPLPPWTEATGPEPTDFLRTLSSGIRLVELHNELVKQSVRRFGEIKSFYTDLGKPYRCADNLRYWIKAAELRWEVKLKLDVMDVVYSRGADTWEHFDRAVLAWSQAVRQELSDEWLGGSTAPAMLEHAQGEFSDRQADLGEPSGFRPSVARG
ncbi:hypothetical protein CAC42_6840 [Sphaceloma murrayae]|uniref:Uncharacterized protein n=1 Tax=Sphaceloma murrayae TaxID=2082308 RepID=A0A2K1QGN4_9PEZI|nr:hypothetical protein CAC42_6840 [Sphaceloma murrayae]